MKKRVSGIIAKGLALLFLSLITHNSLLTTAYGGAFDRIGVGARPKGMGDAYTAVADDLYSVYWNPAGLSKAKRKTLGAAYKDLYGLGLVDYSFLGYVQPGFGQGAVAFGWTRLGTNNTVDYLEYNENTYAFAYGANLKRPFRNLALGVGVKYYHVDYKTGRASGTGLDLGMRYQRNKFTVAVVAQDINNPTIMWQTGAEDKLKVNTRAGIAYTSNLFTVAVDADQINSSKTKTHIGFEKYFKKDGFALRAGSFNVTETLWNTTLGASLSLLKNISMDYAYEVHSELGSTHLIGLNSRF